MGKFKNESVKPITEFVVNAVLTTHDLTPLHLLCFFLSFSAVKLYSLALKPIDDYRNTLYNRASKSIKQNNIRTYGHELFTERIEKVALSYNDDKVFICDDNVHTFNHGHFRSRF